MHFFPIGANSNNTNSDDQATDDAAFQDLLTEDPDSLQLQLTQGSDWHTIFDVSVQQSIYAVYNISKFTGELRLLGYLVITRETPSDNIVTVPMLLEPGKFINNTFPGNEDDVQIVDPQYYDPQGNPVFTLSVPSAPSAGLASALKVGGDWYDYQVSLLNGDDQIVLQTGSVAAAEVGAGGTATISGGSGNQVWIWHDKNVVWTTTGAQNALVFSWEKGSGDGPAAGLLSLNLQTGVGANPWGGTLQFQGVDRVGVGEIANEYILCDNNGDTINSGFGTLDGGANALIVGGTGNDTLNGLDSGLLAGSTVNVLVAGLGTDTLTGGRNTFFDARTVSNIFSYNLGADTITNFRAGASSGDQIDLSAVPGIGSFADVQGLMQQSGPNTVIDFGGGQTITLDNVTASSLTAGNFLFAPEAAFAFTNPGEADTGTTVKIYLAMTGAVTVDTAPGSPTLTLTLDNGATATATYDATASSSAGYLLVFDYVVGSGDHSPDLAVQSVNVNGAVIQDANGHGVDFSPIQDEALGLQINKSLLSVSSVTASVTSGELDAGSALTFTLNMSEGDFTVDTSHGRPSLTLNDGETATYAGFSGNQIFFSYTVQVGDTSSDLTVTGVNLGLSGETAVVQDAEGYSADFSGAANFSTGVQIGPTLFPASVSSDAPVNPGTGKQEADAGPIVHLIVDMNEAVTVGGSPVLSLSDGATATYDSTLSNTAFGTLVFDYNVGGGDQSPDLRVTSYSGGTIEDANNVAADFSGASLLPSGLQIGPSPLTVTSLQASTTGHVATGQTIFLTLQMNETNLNVSGAPGLILNDSEEAFFDSADSNLAAGTLIFEYIVGNDSADPNAADLKITGLDTGQNSIGQSSIRDISGYNADISAAIGVSTGIQVNHALSIASLADNWTTSEADSGQTVEIYLNMTEGVTVDTSGGMPTLTLSDGATATYNPAASNLSAGQIAFAYNVRAADHTPSLNIATINLNNATVKDSSNNVADLTLLGDDTLPGEDNSLPVPLQIGPASVDTVMASQVGVIGPSASIEIGVGFSEFITIDTTHGAPTLTLSNGATATYDAGATATNFDSVIFDYTVGTNDPSGDLEISAFNLNNAAITDLNGTSVDTSNALNQFFGVDVETGPPCYCPGTLIATGRGQKKVENLRIGDLVRTRSGALRPIKWIGRRSYHGRFVRGRKDILPVCIRAGALGDHVPSRDLWISPCHAMYFEDADRGGALIEAKDLVNGVSIVQAEQPERVEYFHIELDSHDVIIAEGALSETFIDDDSRSMFHNALEYDALYTDEMRRPACYCAPRLAEGFVVDAVRRRIALRAGLLRSADRPLLGALRGFVDAIDSRRICGWAQNVEWPEAPVCLSLFAGGRLIGETLANRYRDDLKRAGFGSGHHGFEFVLAAGLAMSADSVEVRRSSDGAVLVRAEAARHASGNLVARSSAA